MKHTDSGTLRRLIDEPLSIESADREHVKVCAACGSRLAEIQKDRDAVATMLAGSPPAADLSAARALLAEKTRLARPRTRSPRIAAGVPLARRWSWSVGLIMVAVCAFAFTPAPNVFMIFQPQQFTTISMTQGELRTLPNLSHFGYLHVDRNLQAKQFSSLSAASDAAGFRPLTPSYVPQDVSNAKTYNVIPSKTSSFTFSASKVAASALRHHRHIPTMPATINGSTISLITHAGVMTVYGGHQDIPSLIVGQTKLPKVVSDGASLKAMESYVLGLPGVSKRLAQQIEAVGKPTNTLPIPIPVNWAFAQHVRVQGHPALLVGDNTGVASVVIWQYGGVVYGVAGALTQDQVLRIADSLR